MIQKTHHDFDTFDDWDTYVTRELQGSLLKCKRGLAELREALVEKYGEDAMARKDKQLEMSGCNV